MVVLGTAVQNRLLGVAKQELGPSGEAVVRETARRTFDRPLDQLTFAELPALLAAVERRESAPASRREAAKSLARAVDGLRAGCDAGVGALVIALVGKRLGSAAKPFLEKVCAKLDTSLADLDRAGLPRLADAARRDAAGRISTGEVEDVEIDANSNDEIGQLAQSFKRMVASVRFLMMGSADEEDEYIARSA